MTDRVSRVAAELTQRFSWQLRALRRRWTVATGAIFCQVSMMCRVDFPYCFVDFPCCFAGTIMEHFAGHPKFGVKSKSETARLNTQVDRTDRTHEQ